MVQISKISTGLTHSAVNLDTKKVLSRAALPTTSGLAVLAGSSMQGNEFPPHNARPAEPGSSVTDPISDQLKHTWHQAENAGSEIVDGVKTGAKNLWESLLDIIDDIF